VVGLVSNGDGSGVTMASAITQSSMAEISTWVDGNGNGTTGRAVSTAGPDLIELTSSAERVFAGAGNDTIRGGGGDDLLYGQQGNDQQYGDAGNDLMDAGLGDDTLFGGDGNDVLGGAAGDDWFDGGNGDDYILGDADSDTIYGSEGNDALRGQPGNDVIDGGTGNDRIWGDKGTNTVTGGAGADSFNLFPGAGVMIVTDFRRAEGDRIGTERGMGWSVRSDGSGGALIDFGGGTQVILSGIAPAAVTSDWFGLA
jgi:Ca2+-binding RTX toxin-like protein